MSDRLDTLFQAARQSPPDTSRQEFGFETRLLARLRSERATPWTMFAWRLAPVFAAIVLALGVWHFTTPAIESFDSALLAQGRGDSWWSE
jgi:hypothetical protein